MIRQAFGRSYAHSWKELVHTCTIQSLSTSLADFFDFCIVSNQSNIDPEFEAE